MSARHCLALAVAVCALCPPPAAAQVKDGPQFAPGQGPRTELPQIDPARAKSGKDLVAALRKGGFVLYLRHTETGTVTEACTASNLTPRGEAEARSIGNSLRDLKVPIGLVLSSAHCRVQDTAKLVALGEVTLEDDLYNLPLRPDHKFHEGRARLLATPPAAGTNTLLVSHLHGGLTPAQALYLDMGETVVFEPDGKGGAAVVARLRAGELKQLVQEAR
jgi:phosphohistidine phosphatase SixA